MADNELLLSEAAIRQIEKLKLAVDEAVKAVADLNKAGADMEAQINKGNLGWAKTIGKMKELQANSDKLDDAYKKLVAASDAHSAAETRHATRLAKLAEAQRTQALLNEQITVTNTKNKDSILQLVTAINAKQKAELNAQLATSKGIEVNKRATLASAAHTVQIQKETVEIGKLEAENKDLIAQRKLLDISTEAGRRKAKELSDGIAENTRIITANTKASEASASTARTVGKGMTQVLGYLRNLAYILPGIGIAGIFNLLFEGIMQVVTGFNKATTAQKALTEAMKDGAKNSAVETWNLDRLYKKATDVNQSMDERREAVNKLQKLFPAYFKNISDEAILNGEAKKTYDELRTSIVAVAKAKAIESAIVKIYNDDMEKEIELTEKYKKAQGAYLTDEGEQLGNTDAYSRYKGKLQFYGKEADAERKRRRNAAEAELADFKADQAKRIKVLTDALEKEEKLIDDRTLPDKKKKAKRTPRGPADMTDNSATDYLNAEKARFMANYELMKKDSEKHAELTKKMADFEGSSLFERQDALAAFYAYKQNLRDLEQTKELKEVDFANIALQNSIAQKKEKIRRGTSEYNVNVLNNEIKAEQFRIEENEKTKQTIVEKYQQERLDMTEQFGAANLQLVNKYSAAEIKGVMERWKWIQAFNKKAAEEELDLIQENLDAWVKMPDDTDRYPEPTEEEQYKFEKKMYHLNTYMELEQTATTLIMGLADAQYAHEMGLIDKREQKLNESYDEDKKRIESSYTNKKDKEEEMLKLDARKEILQKQIDKDRKAAARKQAKDQKATDVASIIGSTYVAVMGALGAKPWTFANIAVAAGIAASGAANLARVIATPLPAYKHGTEDHPGSWAVVGDGGKHELVMEPGKKPWITDKVPTLVNLPKHTIVKPDAEAAMRGAGMLTMFANNQTSTNDHSNAVLVSKMDELIEETKNNKSVTNVEFIGFGDHRDHVRKNIR